MFMSQNSVEQTLRTAVQYHEMGRMTEAETLYRQLLEIYPGASDVWHLLGILAGQTGRIPEAIEHISPGAIAIAPEKVDYRLKPRESVHGTEMRPMPHPPIRLPWN